MAAHVCSRAFASSVRKLPRATRHASVCCYVQTRGYHLHAGLRQGAGKSDENPINPFWEKYRSKIEGVRGCVGIKQDEGTGRPTTRRYADTAPRKTPAGTDVGRAPNPTTPNLYSNPPLPSNRTQIPYSLPPVSDVAMATPDVAGFCLVSYLTVQQ